MGIKIKQTAKGIYKASSEYVEKVKRAPGDLAADAKYTIKRNLKTYGRKFGIGGKETLPPTFIQKYRENNRKRGEHPLDTIKRVTK